MVDRIARGWYYRHYLPHFDGGAITQFVTFHFNGCFSPAMLQRWEAQCAVLPAEKRKPMLHRKINEHLDRDSTRAWLNDPFLAEMVEDALLFFHDQRYILHAWVIMPNHVHTLLTPFTNYSLADITHSWKSFTGHKAVKYLHLSESFWYPESYDRFIRNEEHYQNVQAYIDMNPVNAGLSKTPEEYRWGSARARLEERLSLDLGDEMG